MKTMRLFTAVLMLAAVMSPAHAAMENIIDLGEGNYTILGDKLITITGTSGDTILKALSVIPAGGTILLSGDFKLSESINIKKPITIKSLTGSVIDGQQKDRVIRCQGQGITLENLTIFNGNIVKGGSAEGGGINIDDASVDIINCRITSNDGGVYGGGVNIKGRSNVRLVNCEITKNFAIWGGGGIAAGAFDFFGKIDLELINCTITGNSTFGTQTTGGGLYLIDGNIKKAAGTNCVIENNTPDNVYGNFVLDGQVYTSELPSVSESESESESDSESESSSGGGCNASCLGLLSLAILIIRRKSHRA